MKAIFKFVHFSIYSLSLAIAYVMCRAIADVVLPLGFEPPTTPAGILHYVVAFTVDLMIVLGMVAVGAWSIRWIHGSNSASKAA